MRLVEDLDVSSRIFSAHCFMPFLVFEQELLGVGGVNGERERAE
jgi:hypothetical protein